MKDNKIIAVFGGSFNPPLNSHFSIAQQIINEHENIEKVIFIPVSSKYNKKGLISNEHRLNMLKFVCDKNRKFIVSDIETKQLRQLSTYETLHLLQKEYPKYELCFVIGSDNLKTLSNWKFSEKLLSEFRFLVFDRNDDCSKEIIQENDFLRNYKKSFIVLNNIIKNHLSSSKVREKIKNNCSVRYLMPDEVFYYIEEHQLYKN